jgi:hypothetical protein
VYVPGKFNVVADALSRINESPSSELYAGEYEEEAAEAVALNAVGTVSRPMLTTSMLSEVLRPTRRKGIPGKTSKILRMVNLRNQWMVYFMRWTTGD